MTLDTFRGVPGVIAACAFLAGTAIFPVRYASPWGSLACAVLFGIAFVAVVYSAGASSTASHCDSSRLDDNERMVRVIAGAIWAETGGTQAEPPESDPTLRRLATKILVAVRTELDPAEDDG